jgi:hypothetical protein
MPMLCITVGEVFHVSIGIFKWLQQVLLFSIIIIDINSKNNNKFKSRRNKKSTGRQER